jgi:hypothetical protein
MRLSSLLAALLVPTLTACTPSVCEVDGVAHRVGETYLCADGCNTCTCALDGVTSTRLACLDDTGGGGDTGAP